MAEKTKDEIEAEITRIEQDAIDRMLEKIPIDELVRDYLGDKEADRINSLYEEQDKLGEEVKMTVETRQPIELDEFRPVIHFPKKVVERLGGHDTVAGLIDNILDRYCNEEYFDIDTDV